MDQIQIRAVEESLAIYEELGEYKKEIGGPVCRDKNGSTKEVFLERVCEMEIGIRLKPVL